MGGDLLVRGASRVGLRLGMSPMLVGMTIVAFGTSAPELAASLVAALRGTPGIVLGTLVGSNIANLGFILGLSALAGALPVDRRFSRREAPVLVASGLALAAVAWDGAVTRGEGALLLLALPVALRLTSRAAAGVGGEPGAGASPGRAAAEVLAGLAALPLGAHLLVGGAVDIAEAFGVDERVIGLSVVAIGTSLPELFSSLAAARRGLGGMVIGNVIGSNVFNVFGILGLTALVHPLAGVPPVHVDLLAVAAASLLAAVMFVTGRRLSRAEGAVMVVGYAVFAVVAWR